jgi:hypothetical protein
MKSVFAFTILAGLAANTAASAEPFATAGKPAAAETHAASDSPTDQATPAQARKRGPNTLYCYDMESTGTRVIQRSCRTRADWKAVGVTVPSAL